MACMDKVPIHRVGGSGLKLSVQTNDLNQLKEVIESDCEKVRFGSEFCEWKIPDLNAVKKAYNLVIGAEKEFAYVTPLVTNTSLKRIRRHLVFLEKVKGIDVIINDLGVLNILEKYPNIKPCLGRQLVFIPARCPWPPITDMESGPIESRQIANVFNQTSLNHLPTIRFLQTLGVRSVDVDFIPQSLQYYDFIHRNKLDLCVHTDLIPVAVTRKCHTARFLGEKSPESCSKTCSKKIFLLKQETIGIELFLWGNVVFRFTHPTRWELKKLLAFNFTELVITMNPITGIENREKIDSLWSNICSNM